MNMMQEVFGDAIYSYTRAQAIEDGVLVDVSETAKEAGFSVPVAITAAAWSDCVAWTVADCKRQAYQDEAGRLWDVLWMARVAARHGGDRLTFQFYRLPCGGKGRKPRRATLAMVIGPGDTLEPVITIMMPNED